MVDTRHLELGFRTTPGQINRGGEWFPSAAARLLRRLTTRRSIDDGVAVGATDRELAGLATATPERSFDQAQARTIALQLGGAIGLS